MGHGRFWKESEAYFSDPEAEMFQTQLTGLKGHLSFHQTEPPGSGQLSAHLVAFICPHNFGVHRVPGIVLGASQAGVSRWESLALWGYQGQ